MPKNKIHKNTRASVSVSVVVVTIKYQGIHAHAHISFLLLYQCFRFSWETLFSFLFFFSFLVGKHCVLIVFFEAASRAHFVRTFLSCVCCVWFSCSLFYSVVLLPRFFHFAWKHRYTDGWTQNSAHKNLYDCVWWWWLYAWTANKRKEQNEEEEKNVRKAYEKEMKPKNNNNKKTIIETVYVRR